MITIHATPDEVAALHQLLHRAVLHSGMDVAEAALHWKQKLIVASTVVQGQNGQALPPFLIRPPPQEAPE